MQKAFEKIIEKVKAYYDAVNPYVGNTVTKIVNQVAEEYKSTEHVNCSSDISSEEVCEWRLCDEEANVYDTTCRNPHILLEGSPMDNKYEFCPYCGKKIKVVE